MKSLFDFLWFADWLHERPGFEAMDKYELRAWLVGSAVLHGCDYTALSGLSGILRREGDISQGTWREEIEVHIVSDGVELRAGANVELVKTKC